MTRPMLPALGSLLLACAAASAQMATAQLPSAQLPSAQVVGTQTSDPAAPSSFGQRFDISDATVTFGVSAVPTSSTSGGSTSGGSTSGSSTVAGVTLGGVVFPLLGANYTLGAGLSSAAVSGSVSRALVLTGLGAARARLDGALLFGGGARGSLNASGTLGPVALTLDSSLWSAPLDRTDPLARWAEAPADVRASGGLLVVSGRYRQSRDLVLNLQGALGGQSGVLAYAERRSGELSYRLGGRAATGALGVTAGVSYSDPDSGLTVAADGLLGPGTLGLSASLGLDAPFGEGSSLRAYAAYEPWRTTAAIRRVGVQASFAAGPGTLTLEGRGGSGSGGAFGVGAAVSYTLGLSTLLAAPTTP